jgi:hypothetical protein
VFTGVSGSGKSSLVFGTIAAESQRMINETYSAFVQGFMPTWRGPTSICLDGLTDRDHRRPGAARRRPRAPRSAPHGRGRDAAHPVQSASASPHLGSPKAFSFNVASISGAGAVTPRARRRDGQGAAQLQHRRRDVSACEGRGSVTDFDLTALTTPASRSTRVR